MNRKILCCLCLIVLAEFMQIEATQNEVAISKSEFYNIQMKLWLKLMDNMELIMKKLDMNEKNLKTIENKIQNFEIQTEQRFEKIDNSFVDVNKLLSELNKKHEAHDEYTKTQFEIMENNAKLRENQTKENLENMQKVQNAENSKIIESVELKIKDNQIELVSHFERLQNKKIQYENFANQTIKALQNIENQIKSEYKNITELHSKQIEASFKELQRSMEMLERRIQGAKPKDCSQWDSNYCENSKCLIKNKIYGSQAFNVSCDQQIDNGGWTVIQRRINGSVDFYRNWEDYKVGFGNIDGEFWIGLDKLHALTTTQNMELKVVMRDFNGDEKYAKYDSFKIGTESEGYGLKYVGEYDGNAGNKLSYTLGMKFTTKDRDNDMFKDGNCAIEENGAWWYNDCGYCNLNGKYYQKEELPITGKAYGIYWYSFCKASCSLKYVQMMIRPREAKLNNYKK